MLARMRLVTYMCESHTQAGSETIATEFKDSSRSRQGQGHKPHMQASCDVVKTVSDRGMCKTLSNSTKL